MKKLFIITGANGHLGGTIVRMLNGRPVQVRGLVFGDKKKQDTGSIHYYSGDVREPETLRPLFEGCEDMETIVIHTAGIIDISNHVSPELYDVNVNGTKNILALCREYLVKRLVYVSSVHAIPEQKRGNVTGEIRDFSPDDVVGGYAKTKAEATREVLRAAQEGLDAVVVHPSGILGPYDRSGNHLVQMVAEYLHGTLPACVKGGYDFVDVRDVADAVISSINNGISGESYLCTNQYYEVQQLFQMLQKITGRKPAKTMVPMWFSKLMVYFHQNYRNPFLQPPLTTSYELYSIPEKITFSHQKAKKQLHYTPRPIEETLLDTAQWLVCHHMVQPRPLGCKI